MKASWAVSEKGDGWRGQGLALTLLFFVLAAVAPPAFAQPPSQLDFLGGDWTLHDSSGAQVGRSRIVVQAPGAMLFEERIVDGGEAQPIWFENSERNGGWTQLFVGAAGLMREFNTLSATGVWPIVMGGDVTLRDGTPVKFRLTMSRDSDDLTRRVLEISRDSGATWAPVFDYVYRRSSRPQAD